MTGKKLTEFETWVLDHKGTEPPHSGLYVYTSAEGTYHCKRCEAPLFNSSDKFASHCGWPSFDDEIPGAIEHKPDQDGQRIEIVCKNCHGHLGHVFAGEQFTPKNIRHCVNSVALTFKPKLLNNFRSTVLASGCFWGTQHFLARIPGVVSTEVGYTGGHKENPTYKEVCTGTTGHVEAVRVTYNPEQIALHEILRVFFETHDFTQRDGQGPDLGSQYLSRAFYQSPTEKEVMASVINELKQMDFDVATEIYPLKVFWPGEDYHQHYYESKGDTPYCHRYRRIFQR